MTRITDAMIEAFKQAWVQADADGDAGNRVRRGLTAALGVAEDADTSAEATLAAVRAARDETWFPTEFGDRRMYDADDIDAALEAEGDA